MIGPSTGTDGISKHEVSDDHSRVGIKRIFEDLDIESFCDDVQGAHKRYQYQEVVEASMETVPTSEQQAIAGGTTEAMFSPLPVVAKTTEDDGQVTRLEVLLVDGANCTWTTIPELESQQGITEIAAASPSTSSSLSSDNRQERMIHGASVEGKSSYPAETDYWEPVITISSNHGQPKNKCQAPSNSYHQQEPFDDQETGNLSWLLDFKLDPFIEAADDKSSASSVRDLYNGNKGKANGRTCGPAYANEIKRSCNENGSLHQESGQNFSNLDNRTFASSRCNGPKKPPFTYTELIEHALRERGELTVSAIYQWISEHFPYYKSNDDRWKNSVRHNLSINPHFRKGSKAPHGAGHLWAIANRSGDSKARQTINTSISSSIKQVMKNSVEAENRMKNISHINSIEEIEAATASITQQASEEESENLVNSVTLEHCAEEILSGIKKEVEVQYLVPMMVSNDNESNQPSQQSRELHYPIKESDFLNPVSKEVVAEECGLISDGYLVTDLNPTTLGLNMVEPEIITPENLFGEELSFQFYELSSPSQIQSA